MSDSCMSEPSGTAYDDAFLTLQHTCPALLIPVVNFLFGRSYTRQDKIFLSSNEQVRKQVDGGVQKRISDASFHIENSRGLTQRYHFECQAYLTNGMILRMLEYDTQIAMKHPWKRKDKTNLPKHQRKRKSETTLVSLPCSAVFALRHSKNAPDTLNGGVEKLGQVVEHYVPVLKVQNFSIEKIFRLKMYFLLPFFIFCYEKKFNKYENNEIKLKELTDVYKAICAKLDALERSEELNTFENKTICAMIVHVLALIAKKYPNIKNAVESIMVGHIVEFEAKRVYDEGMAFAKGLLQKTIDEQQKTIGDQQKTIGDQQKTIGNLKKALANQKKASANQRKASDDRAVASVIDEQQKTIDDLKKALADQKKASDNRAEASAIQQALTMIRDKMDFSLIEKYTKIPLVRIEELAHEQGL